MFYSLSGKLLKKGTSFAVVNCGGVAFKCQSSVNSLSLCRENEDVTLYTYLSVREDALELYGFYDERELEFFKLLISVSGVGPKAALAILSSLTVEKLVFAITSSDIKSITKAQGVGAKIANRIVVELKDKVQKGYSYLSAGENEDFDASPFESNSKAEEAVAALTMLGYSTSEASKAVRGIDTGLSTEDIIKAALKAMM